jgi:hypothetical protein
MIYKNIIAIMVFIIAMVPCGIAYADAGADAITFVNSSGRAIWVEYWGDSKCITPPAKGSHLVARGTSRQFPLKLKANCVGESSIKFNITMKTANTHYPEVGGTVTYRKYRDKENANKWSQKIDFVPTGGVNYYNFIRATCGASHEFCKGLGRPFTNAQAAVAVLNPGLAADDVVGGYRNNR